jgi:hypothetical protein
MTSAARSDPCTVARHAVQACSPRRQPSRTVPRIGWVEGALAFVRHRQCCHHHGITVEWTGHQLVESLLDERCVEVSRSDLVERQQLAQESNVGDQPGHVHLGQRRVEPRERLPHGRDPTRSPSRASGRSRSRSSVRPPPPSRRARARGWPGTPPRPVGRARARTPPRVLGVDASLDRRAPEVRGRPGRSPAGSPAATRSCCSTRSRPHTISVTGCSTCKRVFISMKNGSSGDRPTR